MCFRDNYLLHCIWNYLGVTENELWRRDHRRQRCDYHNEGFRCYGHMVSIRAIITWVAGTDDAMSTVIYAVLHGVTFSAIKTGIARVPNN